MRIAWANSLQTVARWFHERVEFWFAVLTLSVAWFYYPYCQTGPTLCIWKKLLGIPCPGCGLTRGVCLLVHGRWVEAVSFNPLSLLAVGILAFNALRGFYEIFGNLRSVKGRAWAEGYARRRNGRISVLSEVL
jgi:Protein of unknown function (DUF2752)